MARERERGNELKKHTVNTVLFKKNEKKFKKILNRKKIFYTF